MSDRQVLNIFSKADTKICGRFAADQLQRTLKPEVEEKRKAWWVAAFMPLLFLFGKSDAQRKNCEADSSIILPMHPAEIIMGKVLPPDSLIKADSSLMPPDNTIPVKGEINLTHQMNSTNIVNSTEKKNPNYRLIITGRVIDENGNPVPYASVIIKTGNAGAVADSSGFFQIRNDEVYLNQILTILITGIGFEPLEIKTSTAKAVRSDDNYEQNPLLKIVVNATLINSQYTGEVLIVAGGAFAYERINVSDTIPALIRKVFKVEAFRMFPNPASRGNDISIALKTKSRYTIQLFDNNSQLISVKQGDGANETSLITFTIPFDIAAGTYFICVIDEQKKKRYTNKILIQ